MSMKVLKLHLHCGAGDALIMIEILDQLRDAIAETYYDEIREMLQEVNTSNSDQTELPFDDPISL